jgi:hypothetical protein
MAVIFGKVYEAQPPRGGWSCLLAANSAIDGTKPWTGIYIASDHQQSAGLISQLSAIFQQFENQQFNLLAFLNFAPNAGTSAAQIGAALDAINWSAVQPTARAGLVTWIANPTAISQAAVTAAPCLPFIPYKSSPRSKVVPSLNNPAQQPLLPLAPGTAGGENLYVTGADWGATSVLIGANSSDDAIALTCSVNLVLARGIAGADQQKVAVSGISAVQIPLSDTNDGCLVFDGAFGAPISGIGLGFQYSFSVVSSQQASSASPPPASEANPPPASGAVTYPLLNTPDGLAGRATSAVLSILAPLDNSHCYFSLPAAGGPVRTGYRTILDRVVLFTPMADGSSRLVFNPGYGNTRYLTPTGAFAVSIDGGSEPSKYGLGSQLLCGLSGVEYIHFAAGDLLQYFPGANASVSVQADPDLPKPANVAFAFDPAAACQTAWAMLLPAPGQSDPRQYYSEPDQAPFFFANSAISTDAKELGYYALSLSQLPNTAGPKTMFPLLPYAGLLPAASGVGADPAYVESFEYQLINPTRKAAIESMAVVAPLQSHTSPTGDQNNVTAITPEGHAAVFDDAGNWLRLRIALMSSSAGTDIEITFNQASGAAKMPQPLQEAFLTNQQFLVVTSVANLGAFTNRLTMSHWPFILDPSKNTTVGDYRNVIIFKSANATVSQLARHPELWTRYADFNNATTDPNGTFLSNWLVDYLNQAKALYDGGQGVASLENFCELIDDPTWNGFLALRVDIDTQSTTNPLPDQIEALLAGIDKTLFFAHHIGNQVNHVEPSSSAPDGYALNSAMFGLVHYVDPNLGAEVNNLPAYIANPQAYDFKVLTLEAVFQNAELVTFSNKSLLTLSTIFGDSVLQTSAAGVSGANTLVLVGAYNSKANPAYTFSTAQGAISDFYLGSDALNRVEITRATMTVTEVSSLVTNVTGELQCCTAATTEAVPQGEQGYLARFNLSGNLQTNADATFDLLSYDYLGFQNLGLDMYLVTGGGDRSFAFDSSRMGVALVQNVAPDPSAPSNASRNVVRLGGLLAQFPLQLSGFITGCGGRQPAAMGYRTLETTKPSGITPATLGSGDWYALSFNLNLGGQGALGQNGGLAAQMLLAWAPGGNSGGTSVLPALKIAGPGGVSLSFDIEGVVKFGAADIVLNNMPSVDSSPAQFVLMFESIAFSVLSFSFPPKGSTNIYLFGDAGTAANPIKPGDPIKPTLGWFGGYVEQPAAKTT